MTQLLKLKHELQMHVQQIGANLTGLNLKHGDEKTFLEVLDLAIEALVNAREELHSILDTEESEG